MIINANTNPLPGDEPGGGRSRRYSSPDGAIRPPTSALDVIQEEAQCLEAADESATAVTTVSCDHGGAGDGRKRPGKAQRARLRALFGDERRVQVSEARHANGSEDAIDNALADGRGGAVPAPATDPAAMARAMAARRGAPSLACIPSPRISRVTADTQRHG